MSAHITQRAVEIVKYISIEVEKHPEPTDEIVGAMIREVKEHLMDVADDYLLRGLLGAQAASGKAIGGRIRPIMNRKPRRPV